MRTKLKKKQALSKISTGPVNQEDIFSLVLFDGSQRFGGNFSRQWNITVFYHYFLTNL